VVFNKVGDAYLELIKHSNGLDYEIWTEMRSEIKCEGGKADLKSEIETG
jgi:hypothetical protein